MRFPEVPFFAWIAWRYLKSTRQDAFVTFLSITAAGGIGLGVGALILALAALTGFQTALRNDVLGRTHHIEISMGPDTDPAGVMTDVEAVRGVVESRLLVSGRGWLIAAGRAKSVEVTGFTGSVPPEFPNITGRGQGVYLSDRLVTSLGLELGETVEIVSGVPTLSPLGPQPRVRRVELTGTFSVGSSEQVERAALALSDALSLFGDTGLRVVVDCESLESSLDVADEIAAVLPPSARITTWHDTHSALLFALRLEKSLMFVGVFLIVIVAGMALISDLTLILANKQPEIGMLGAMGATQDSLRNVFLTLGVLLVALGGTVGIVLGVGGAWALDRFELLSLPREVYFLDHVPFKVAAADVVWVLAATVLLTMSCIWLAARRAGALSPVEALRR